MAPPMERRSPSLAESRQWTRRFLRGLGVDGTLPATAELPAAYSALVRGVLSSAAVSVVPATPASPRVSCTLTVSPAAVVSAPPPLHISSSAESYPIPALACRDDVVAARFRDLQNAYNTLHGGMVAAVAEAVGMACARAAAGDKEMFLGELSTAYLSAARLNVSTHTTSTSSQPQQANLRFSFFRKKNCIVK